jgi:hypothetical protein
MMTSINNPASPGRPSVIPDSDWRVGPPLPGARPLRHPAFDHPPLLPDRHPGVRQHEPLTPRQPVRQNSPVDQRGAHH